MTSTPRAGRWQIDTSTAHVAFAGRATRFSPTVQARFLSVEGTVQAGPAPTDAVVDVTVDVRTMTSGNRAWDDLVAAVDPFAATRFPTARYRSTAVSWHGGSATVDGVLTLRGVERPVRLQAEHALSSCGGRLVLRGSGEVDREAFGVRLDVPGAALVIPRRLRLSLDVVAVHDDALALAA
jgi:polyisoprenoid-binding protein YceI